GFPFVAAPLDTWVRDGTDLAFVQRFLAGGAEGWALALTSIRDLLSAGPDNPELAGGDFSFEARRLGSVTAQLHLAMARAFGSSSGDAREWSEAMRENLASIEDGDERAAAAAVYERL